MKIELWSKLLTGHI